MNAVNNTKIDKSLSNVLCCINFNEEHYDNIDFLKSLYGNFFDIVFYGPKEKEGTEVRQIDHQHGYLGYGVMLDAIQRFRNYQGYIFLNDDCIMNVWQFFGKDKDKIWLQPYHSRVNCYDTKKIRWLWLEGPWGRVAYKRALLEIPLHYRTRLKLEFGSEDVMFCGPSDFFYIPARLKKDFLSFFNILFKNKVFTEIAVPTGLFAIEDKTRITILKCQNKVRFHLPLTYRIYRNVSPYLNAKIFYRKGLPLYHALKMSVLRNRRIIKYWFDIYYFQKDTLRSKFLRILDSMRPLMWFLVYVVGFCVYALMAVNQIVKKYVRRVN